jgi:hypothetical protein
VIDPAGLTARGRKLAKTVPREITVRLFAAAFEFREAKRSLRPLVRVTRPSGTTSRQLGPRFSVGLPLVR